MPKTSALRVLFDKNVPVAVRGFLANHEVRTIVDLGWPIQIENGDLLSKAEAAGFELLVTADQNIKYQQNLKSRKLALVVLGSNIWPVVLKYATTIALEVGRAIPGSYCLIEMPLPPKPSWTSKG